MKTRRNRLASLLGIVICTSLLCQQPAHAASQREACAAPDETTGAIAALPQVARALVPGGHLRVLAVGSATMFGPEASFTSGTLGSQALSNSGSPSVPPVQPLNQEASDRAFPRQMAKALQAATPGLDVQVVVKGGRGMTASDMLALLRTELHAAQYQLVLWQTGTVEAVRNSPPGDFAQILSNGAEAVEAAGANLVLIDPQYSRFLQTNSNLDPYTQALQQTAAMPGVILFHRFDLMRNWANDGQIDLERTAKADRKRVGDLLHACLGAHLARMVAAGARS
jgi:hypothetical protein